MEEPPNIKLPSGAIESLHALPNSTSADGSYPQHGSLIWQAAIDRYYEELRKGGIKGSSIDKDLWNIKTPNDLLGQIQALAPAEARVSGTWTRQLRRLEPVLLSLNDFAAVIACALG